LEKRNVTFEINAADTEGDIPSWHDYSTVDVVLAVRPKFDDGHLRPEKPASKLINAWHAGTPAILGPEYAYRELRTSPHDYLEVDSLEEAMSAIDQLLEDRSLYAQMVQRCKKRACEFTFERITERWAEVLFECIPRVVAQPSVRWTRPVPSPLRQVMNWGATLHHATNFVNNWGPYGDTFVKAVCVLKSHYSSW